MDVLAFFNVIQKRKEKKREEKKSGIRTHTLTTICCSSKFCPIKCSSCGVSDLNVYEMLKVNVWYGSSRNRLYQRDVA